MHLNPYYKFVSDIREWIVWGKSLPLGSLELGSEKGASEANVQAPVALIFAPHPDDECLIGALPMRLLRETGMRVINIAVTLGSDRTRQQERWKELTDACNWIGFGLEAAAPNGLEHINPKTRSGNPIIWKAAARVIAGALERYQPRVIFFPHEQDAHSTHIGTHLLVKDALKSLPTDFGCFVIETEFWVPMSSPNLMIESSARDVAELVSALTFHVGEVQRNPYHLRLPAWMIDNVRRGAELVGVQGGTAPDFVFATLYRLRRWENGRLKPLITPVRHMAVGDSIASIFAFDAGENSSA